MLNSTARSTAAAAAAAADFTTQAKKQSSKKSGLRSRYRVHFTLVTATLARIGLTFDHRNFNKSTKI